MTSRTTETFRRMLAGLPPVRRQARAAYHRWHVDPWHRGLQFKRVHAVEPIWSVRVSLDRQAVRVRTGEAAVWFWTGSYACYDALLART